MTLKQWEQVNKWLIAYETSKDEIGNLLAVGDRNLRDCGVAGLSADTRLALAYAAALEFARTALAAAGYRPSRGSDHHVRVIESLEHTIAWDSKRIRRLDGYRKARNVSSYERAGEITDAQATDAQKLARDLRADVVAWLKQTHPELT
jgi:hypothetical protein